jgi:hypothetical protein
LFVNGKTCIYIYIYQPNSEGISVRGKELFFISKVKKLLYILDLDGGTYRRVSTRSGRFGGQPDQIEIVTGSNSGSSNSNNTLMLFTEDGGGPAGIHGRTGTSAYYTVLESSSYTAETTGLALSPDKKHLYFAHQKNGTLFDVTRNDGLAFDGATLPPNYRRRQR